MNESDRDALCEALVGYLREHPNAMDTLTGIAGWWLPRYRVQTGVERVVEALRTLEERGVIERVGSGDRAMFRLRKRDDAR